MPPTLPAILLIEKDEITLELYERELSKSFTVMALMELTGALEILGRLNILAVIIEPEVGAGEGWKLIAAIPQACPGRHVPVIVCSTRDEPRASSKGIATYLTKPVLPKTLREKTLDIVGR